MSKNKKIICGWRDDNSNHGEAKRFLEYLRHKRVTSIELSDDNDLKIVFEEGLVYDIFCDITDERGHMNYHVSLGSEYLTVGVCGKITLYNANNS